MRPKIRIGIFLTYAVLAVFSLARSQENDGRREQASVINIKEPQYAGGAKGDGMTDDTAAIAAAHAAFCSGKGGRIYFPPGSYVLVQPQIPSTKPIIEACPGEDYFGDNGNDHGTPFATPPQVTIRVKCGSKPNGAAAFDFTSTAGNNVTFENLIIDGCSQAISGSGTVINFKNMSLQVGKTGLPDNAALRLYNTFWIWWEGGSIISQDSSVPTILMTAEKCTGCPQIVGLLYVSDAILAGGQVRYVQRATGASIPGNWVFRNVTRESAASDFLYITKAPEVTFNTVGPITLDHVGDADNSNSSSALINLDSTGTTLTGVHINSSASGGGGFTGPAIKVTHGAVDYYAITSCEYIAQCSSMVVDGMGKPVGSGSIQNQQGVDYVTDTNLNSSASHLVTSPGGNLNPGAGGPAIRVTKSGQSYASYGIDALNGYMFGNGAQAGWNSQISESPGPALDISFAASYPPSNVSATTSNVGGSLQSGKYYLYMVSTTARTCASANSFSAPSTIAGPYVVAPGIRTASLRVTWNAAPRGVVPTLGYCILVGSTPMYNPSNWSSEFIEGQFTTTSTLKVLVGSPGAFPITYQMVLVDQLTPNGAVFNGMQTPPVTVSALPQCISGQRGTEGAIRSVSDSGTAAWGEPIIGQGSNHVLAYCDGKHWTVMAK
jgi:hypothetical protein